MSGTFTPVHELGEGAFGVVIAATQKNNDARALALKIIVLHGHTESGCEENLRRNLREARLQARLRHENIVPFVGAAVAPSGNFMIFAMVKFPTSLRAVVGGPTLVNYPPLEHLNQPLHPNGLYHNGRVPLMLLELLSGVAFIHSAGVLHRDLKPENILYNPLDGGRVVICDFGLARSEIDEVDSEENHVNTEYVVTRYYRAPEVILTPGCYGAPMDVWAIGCIFAELLGSQVLLPGSRLNQVHQIFFLLGRPIMRDIDFIKNINMKETCLKQYLKNDFDGVDLRGSRSPIPG